MKKILFIVLGLSVFAFFAINLSTTSNQHVQVETSNKLTLQDIAQFSLPEPAASLIWHPNSQRWLVGTQSSDDLLGSRPAQLLLLSQDFDFKGNADLETSGDLFGLSLVSQTQLAASSYDSKLIFLKPVDESWAYVGKRRLFQDRLRHRTHALLWDEERELFVSCEYLGAKLCYQHSREGQKLKDLPILQLDDGLAMPPSESDLSSIVKYKSNYLLLSESQKTISLLNSDSFQIEDIASFKLPANEKAIALASLDEQLFMMSAVRSRDNQTKIYTLDLKE